MPQLKSQSRNPAARSVCAATMTLAMAMAPTWTEAHDPTKGKPMSSDSMDHSKMADMKSDMSMTGDVDYDFAANMRMHHQMAVDMSEAYLKNGKNPQMLQMARDIAAAQKKEIATFDTWMEAHQKSMKPTSK